LPSLACLRRNMESQWFQVGNLSSLLSGLSLEATYPFERRPDNKRDIQDYRIQIMHTWSESWVVDFKEVRSWARGPFSSPANPQNRDALGVEDFR
jgi:hypothetical protein